MKSTMPMQGGLAIQLVRMAVLAAMTLTIGFTLADYRYSKKVTILVLLALYAEIVGVNGWLFCQGLADSCLRLIPLTVTVPTLLVFFLLVKDHLMKMLFNFWTMVVCALLIALTGMGVSSNFFHDSVLADLIVRILYYVLVIFVLVKYVRNPYREFVQSVNKCWGVSSLIPFALSLVIYSTAFYPFSILEGDIPLLFLLSIHMLTVVCYVVLYLIFKGTQRVMMSRQIRSSLRMQADFQKNNLESIQTKIHLSAIYRHDLRHYSRMICQLLTHNEVEKALEFAKKFSANLEEITPHPHCENVVLDAAISGFSMRIEKSNILLAVRGGIDGHFTNNFFEFSVIFSNCFENALDACEKAPENIPRQITVDFIDDGRAVGFRIRNTCSVPVLFDAKGYPIPPDERDEIHGIGIKSVAYLVERYHGTLNFRLENGVFSVAVVFYPSNAEQAPTDPSRRAGVGAGKT